MKSNNDDKSIIDNDIEKTVSMTTSAIVDDSVEQENDTHIIDKSSLVVSNKKTPMSKLAILSLLLIIILAAIVGFSIDYYLKHHNSTQTTIDTLVIKQKALLDKIEKKLKDQSEVNQRTNNDVVSTVEKQLTKQQQAQRIINQKISELSGRRPSDWLLAEANYLVTMAGRKLWQEKDQKTAAALLVTADKRISEMNDESLINLRLALAKDIATLSALPKDQSQDVALSIDGLLAQIDNLKLNIITLAEKEEVKTPEQLTSDDSRLAHLKRNWSVFLDGILKVRRHEGAAIPLMSAKQQWYLEENLKNKLIQAQLAVYRKQQQAYSRSIELSNTWVLQYFDREDSVTTFMLNELEKLQKININVQYPRDLLSRNMIGDELVRRNIISATATEQ